MGSDKLAEMALALNTVNGGIRLDNLPATISFHAVNGGVSLSGLGGHVPGNTVNGGLSITLAGTTWVGQGLDVQIANGGINWKPAPGYSARLFTSTDVGSVRRGPVRHQCDPAQSKVPVAAWHQQLNIAHFVVCRLAGE